MSEAVYWRSAPQADYAVLGDPVGHSWSPAMHRAAYRARGLALEYVALRVPREEFADAAEFLRGRGYAGVNCTVPLKECAFAWAESDVGSRPYGALNTLRLDDRTGTNTDAPGLLDTFRILGVPPRAPVLLLGAGGTARAVALTLVRAGHPLRIHNRTPANAERLVRELRLEAEVVGEPDPRGAAVVLNSTSAGLSGDALAIDWSRAESGALAYDLLYAADPTPFLAEAAAAGLRTVDGRELLAAQGARSFAWWLGGEPPFDVMRAALP